MGDRPEFSPVLYRNQRREFPIIERGEGVYLYDRDGKRYLDAMAGAGVVAIGHGVTEVVDAIHRQASNVAFAYGGQFTTEVQMRLAELVVELAPAGLTKAFFVSGGAEATESALKMARQYFVEIGAPERQTVIGRWGSFHGNTLGALAASGRVPWQELYGPMMRELPHIEPSYCYRCPLGKTYPGCGIECAEDLERTILREGPESVAAFIADPIVGSSLGAATPPDEYFPRIREICDRYGVLLVADEVLTGFGRTGRAFALDHWDVVPDLIVCGKGISSGYAPLGAVLVSEQIAGALNKGSGLFVHGHTYGGNPLACSAGLAVQEYMHEHGLIERSAELGPYLHEQATRLLERPSVGDVRGGKGLFLGVEFVADKGERRPYPRERKVAETVLEAALEQGITLFAGGGDRGHAGDCIIVAPPLVITRAQIDEAIDLLEASIVEAEARLGIGLDESAHPAEEPARR